MQFGWFELTQSASNSLPLTEFTLHHFTTAGALKKLLLLW